MVVSIYGGTGSATLGGSKREHGYVVRGAPVHAAPEDVLMHCVIFPLMIQWVVLMMAMGDSCFMGDTYTSE